MNGLRRISPFDHPIIIIIIITTWGALARMLLEAAATGCGVPGALGGMWRIWRAWVSMTFGELLGIVWVSVTFGELLLHWVGSERRPGDGSSGAGHPETGARGTLRSLKLAPRAAPRPGFGVSRAAAAVAESAFRPRPVQ